MLSKLTLLFAFVAYVQAGSVRSPDAIESSFEHRPNIKEMFDVVGCEPYSYPPSCVNEIINFIKNFTSNFPNETVIEEFNGKIIPKFAKPHVARDGLSAEDSDLLEYLAKVGGIAAVKSEYKASSDPQINAWISIGQPGEEIKAAFTQFYGLNEEEVEAVRISSKLKLRIHCNPFQLESALVKLPPFIGPVVRNTDLDQQSITKLDNSFSNGAVVYIKDFVKNVSNGTVVNIKDFVKNNTSCRADAGMATAPIGLGEVFAGRPFQIIIMSKTGRYICPIKDIKYQMQPEVLFMNTISLNGFVVLGKSVSASLTIYYLKEL